MPIEHHAVKHIRPLSWLCVPCPDHRILSVSLL